MKHLDKTQTACECEEHEFGKLPVPPDINFVLDPLVKT